MGSNTILSMHTTARGMTEPGELLGMLRRVLAAWYQATGCLIDCVAGWHSASQDFSSCVFRASISRWMDSNSASLHIGDPMLFPSKCSRSQAVMNISISLDGILFNLETAVGRAGWCVWACGCRIRFHMGFSP